MLFNSFEFIFLFLPAAFVIWSVALARLGIRVALSAVAAMSLVFYSQWSLAFLPVLLFSIFANFVIGGRIIRARDRASGADQNWLRAGIALNLSILGFFKYAFFVGSNITAAFHTIWPLPALVLPLGISFITFQKIAYLVDCSRGQVEKHDFVNYIFFVTFFPQLIAGPIVHHKQLTSQADPKRNPLFFSGAAFGLGAMIFAMGLVKKTVLADSLAVYATPVFDPIGSDVLNSLQAWQGVLAYTFQLYFDFSGYSDMAVGLALMFGFRLPINFASPYKSLSIIDFWRRWHMTLSAFLKDYVYIPLGGNRFGRLQRYRNLFITMFLAGVWHGAGWTFVLWGLCHAGALLVNHAYRDYLKPALHAAADGSWGSMRWTRGIVASIGRTLSWGMTFLFVALAWVLFRSPDLDVAVRVYKSMFSDGLAPLRTILGWRGTPLVEILAVHPQAASSWILIGAVIAFLMPNSMQLVSYESTPNRVLAWRPSWCAGIATGCLLWLAMKWMAVKPPTEFLYFNF